MDCFHFIPGSRLNLTDKVEYVIGAPNFHLILDLEDAVTDVDDEDHARELKQDARRRVLEWPARGNVYIRVNSPNSVHWEDDVRFLSELDQQSIAGLVVPKVNGERDIEEARRHLQPGLDIIAIIETISGVKNIEEIARTDIGGVIFGHHDYFMDEGVFPVPGSLLTSQRYRDVMETIIAATTSRNIKYVDGIYPLLNDTKGIDQVCQYLQRYGVPLGKLSVHKNHIDRIVGFKPKTVFAPTPKPAGYVTVDSSDDHVSHVDKLSLARQIVEVYEARNRARSIAKLPGHYLSPQMYMLARQYLEKHQPSQAPTERTLQSHQ